MDTFALNWLLTDSQTAANKSPLRSSPYNIHYHKLNINRKTAFALQNMLSSENLYGSKELSAHFFSTYAVD